MEETDIGTVIEHTAATLTSRQRNVVVISRVVANDLKRNGTTAEAHTAALLDLVADAVSNNYEAELVQVARAWRRQSEAER